MRGRIRFGDQIGRRFDTPFPIEVAFDEFTEDIEKNRLLKTVIYRLGHTFIRSAAVRQGVRGLLPASSAVPKGVGRRLCFCSWYRDLAFPPLFVPYIVRR